jgi:hypothetical protein
VICAAGTNTETAARQTSGGVARLRSGRIGLLQFSGNERSVAAAGVERFAARRRYCHDDVISLAGSGTAQMAYTAVNHNRKI